jgi:hypothetical protein
MNRLFDWLVQLGRSEGRKEAEILVLFENPAESRASGGGWRGTSAQR